MGDFLNVVYEVWDEQGPIPNFISTTKLNKFKILDGLFRFYGINFLINNCKLSDVYEKPNENFYYFINPEGNSLYMFHQARTIPFSDEVKNCFLNQKNFNVVFLNEHEYESLEYVQYINDYCEQNNFDKDRVYIVNNNTKLNEFKKILNTDINVYSLGFLLKFIASHMVLRDTKFNINKTGKLFLCHNRSPKPHRYALLVLLKKHGLLDNVDWSLIMGWSKIEIMRNGHKNCDFYSPFFNKNEVYFGYDEEIRYFDSFRIKKSQFEVETDWFTDGELKDGFDWKDIYELKSFEESYINIVTESNFFEPSIHITEKSIKPFYFYQFPIFLSSQHHVKYFKEKYELDFFEDIIDHSYDNIEDNKERLFAVFNEIKRISENKNQIIEFYKNNQERFEENKRKIISLEKSKDDFNFFKNLINKEIKK